jgi:hypothetical protein
MRITEYDVTWRLASFFSWVRSPFARTKWWLDGKVNRLSRWIMPPTLHQLRVEARCRKSMQGLMSALETGFGGPPGTALKIEDLSAVMTSIVYCGRCPLVLVPGQPRVPCTHLPAKLRLRTRVKYWIQNLLPVRVVQTAWSYYD